MEQKSETGLCKNPVNLNENFCLDEKQAHHIFDVLRSSPKETIRLVHEDEIYLAHPQEKPFLYVFGVEKLIYAWLMSLYALL